LNVNMILYALHSVESHGFQNSDDIEGHFRSLQLFQTFLTLCLGICDIYTQWNDYISKICII